MKNKAILFFTMVLASPAFADISVRRISADLSKEFKSDSLWARVGGDQTTVILVGQPMVPPKPKTTTTQSIGVSAVHDGKVGRVPSQMEGC
ncbi:MAG: hypothetical protein HC902_06580 [Calothrix sp. SM1_5_4]|nr:hypothetical protein [Calothrix sp. SM1_5_4]